MHAWHGGRGLWALRRAGVRRLASRRTEKLANRHFGGHRFAATAVDLPSGYLWAHLTPELAVRVARREVHPAEVAQHLRGFAGLPALAQVLDRELLIRHGWDWLRAQRRAEMSGETVTLYFELDSVNGTARAEVSPAPSLKIPGSSHKPDLGDVKQWQLDEVTLETQVTA